MLSEFSGKCNETMLGCQPRQKARDGRGSLTVGGHQHNKGRRYDSSWSGSKLSLPPQAPRALTWAHKWVLWYISTSKDTYWYLWRKKKWGFSELTEVIIGWGALLHLSLLDTVSLFFLNLLQFLLLLSFFFLFFWVSKCVFDWLAPHILCKITLNIPLAIQSDD